MLDNRARAIVAPTLDTIAVSLENRGVSATAVTTAGWLCGITACIGAATHFWLIALVLWIANRILDGLDGPIARHRGATDLGGFLDIVSDFSIYAGFIVAIAIAEPSARLACVALLATYYVSGTAFLAFSSLAERRNVARQDGRSLRFVGGLAEGTETIAAYVTFCLFPAHAAQIAWTFAAAVGITAIQRVLGGVHALGGTGTESFTSLHTLDHSETTT